MLDQFSLTAMAVNYTRAPTQHDPPRLAQTTPPKRLHQPVKPTECRRRPSWGNPIPSQDIIRCNFIQKKHKNLNVIIEKRVQMQGKICMSQDRITLEFHSSERIKAKLCSGSLFLWLRFRFVQEIWGGSEFQAVLFARLLVLHSRSWRADLFHSHPPVGGAAGSVAQVSALFQKKTNQKTKNTTSLGLSVQHSTTHFSFCHFF